MGSNRWRDLAERVFWTAVSAGLAAIPVVIADLDPLWAPVLTAAINYLTVLVRQRLDALPSPGEGLPGLPT